MVLFPWSGIEVGAPQDIAMFHAYKSPRFFGVLRLDVWYISCIATVQLKVTQNIGYTLHHHVFFSHSKNFQRTRLTSDTLHYPKFPTKYTISQGKEKWLMEDSLRLEKVAGKSYQK